jgi:hypothetical protein
VPYSGLYGEPKTVNSIRGPLGRVNRMVALLCWRYVMVLLEVNSDRHLAGS